MKNGKDNRYNHNNNKKQHYRHLIPMGSKVYIHATHPGNSKAIYLCEARVVRQPRRQDDERYKVIITGVQTFSNETEAYLRRLIGMKILRDSKSLSQEKPWKYSSDGTWVRLQESEADQITRRTISNIKKDAVLQRRHRVFQRLD